MKIKTKSKKVNKAWLNDHVNDPYVKLAQKEGYRARAAYKLKEIDETLRLIQPGPGGGRPGFGAGRLEPVPAPPLRARDGARGAPGALNGTIIALDLLDGADRGRALPPGRLPRGRGAARSCEAAAGGPAGGRGGVGHGAQPVGHRVVRRGAHGAPGRTGGGIRAARTCSRTARWSARSSTAAATASWSSCSRTASGSSSRSSPRPRATSRPKPFWSASVSSRCLEAPRCECTPRIAPVCAGTFSQAELMAPLTCTRIVRHMPWFDRRKRHVTCRRAGLS